MATQGSTGSDAREVDETTRLLPVAAVHGNDAIKPNIPVTAGEETAVVDNQQDGPSSTSAVSPARTRIGIACFGILILLQAMNISMVTTTQGSIAEDLNVSEGVVWFSAAYLIAMSSLNPLIGKLSQVFSSRSCIFVSSILLAIGSLIAAFAQNLRVFILGRAISGSGASGILTVSVIVVLELVGQKRRGLAMAAVNSGFTAGVALGAVVAGALQSSLGWRSSLYLQVPFILIAGVGIMFTLPKSRKKFSKDDSDLAQRVRNIDYVGAVCLTGSIILLLYSLSAVGGIPKLPLILSVITFATFILNEVKLATDPIVPLSLLTSRALLTTCLSTGGYMMARWAALFYSPIYALAVRGWSPTTAGTLLIPTNIGFAVGGLTVGWLHVRRSGSFYLPAIIALTVFPCTMIAMAWLANTHSPSWMFIVALFLNGACTGASLNYTLAHLLHRTTKDSHVIAASLMGTFRGLAGSFGTSIGGGLFLRTLKNSLEAQFADNGMSNEKELIRHLLGSPDLVYRLKGVERAVAIRGYEDAFRILWLAGAGLAAVMVLVQALTGRSKAVDDSEQSTVSDEAR